MHKKDINLYARVFQNKSGQNKCQTNNLFVGFICKVVVMCDEYDVLHHLHTHCRLTWLMLTCIQTFSAAPFDRPSLCDNCQPGVRQADRETG